jgi:hypothetical protein
MASSQVSLAVSHQRDLQALEAAHALRILHLKEIYEEEKNRVLQQEQTDLQTHAYNPTPRIVQGS